LRLQVVVSLTQFAYGWWRWQDLQYFARAAYPLPPLRSRRCDIQLIRADRRAPQIGLAGVFGLTRCGDGSISPQAPAGPHR
jgi:hypothetical protein